MKKMILLFLLSFVMLAGCKEETKKTEIVTEPETEQKIEETEAVEEKMVMTIGRGGGTSALTFYSEENGILKGDISNSKVEIDRQPSSLENLKDGMAVEIEYNGGIARSYPGQFMYIYKITAFSFEEGYVYNSPGLYTKIIQLAHENDYFIDDSEKIYVDISKTPFELTAQQKEIFKMNLRFLFQREVELTTREELVNNNTIITGKKNMQTEEVEVTEVIDGVLITISESKKLSTDKNEFFLNLEFFKNDYDKQHNYENISALWKDGDWGIKLPELQEKGPSQ